MLYSKVAPVGKVSEEHDIASLNMMNSKMRGQKKELGSLENLKALNESRNELKITSKKSKPMLNHRKKASINKLANLNK
jgi:hypothetical protein